MKVVVHREKVNYQAIFDFFLTTINAGVTPTLVLGSQSFPFHEFIDYGNKKGFHYKKSGQLIIGQVVNMHHVRTLLSRQDENFLPVFLNFSLIYCDDIFDNDKVPPFLMRRDLKHLDRLCKFAIFLESGHIVQGKRNVFEEILFYCSDLYIEDSTIVKNHTGLIHKKEKELLENLKHLLGVYQALPVPEEKTNNGNFNSPGLF